MFSVLSATGLAGLLAISNIMTSAVNAQALPLAEADELVANEPESVANELSDSEIRLEQALPETGKLAPVIIQSQDASSTVGSGETSCAAPVLERQQLYLVADDESLAAIAQRYGITVATIQGLNPVVREAEAVAGQTLQIPPYDGVQVETEGESWAALGDRYGVSADLLFEQNGCTKPGLTAFIPGLEWSAAMGLNDQEASQQHLEQPQTDQTPSMAAAEAMAAGATVEPSHRSILNGYPLARAATSLVEYGWQVAGTLNKATFHSGVDLSAALGDGVFAVGNGTVAYAGKQEGYGNLVVVNHAQGLQTRYAHLSEIDVTQGQVIEKATQLGTVGQTGLPSVAASHLHFEVRLNSQVGWVAQDPSAYFLELVGVR